MAYSFGGGVRPELGRTDFTPFLQGSVQGAQMQARGAENMAAGVSQFLAKAGEGVKAYQENKAINTMFNSTIDDAIKLNEEGGGELARVLKIADPSDRGAWAAGIKSLGEGDKRKGSMAVRTFMMEMAQKEKQRAEIAAALAPRPSRVGEAIERGLRFGDGGLGDVSFNAEDFKGRQPNAQELFTSLAPIVGVGPASAAANTALGIEQARNPTVKDERTSLIKEFEYARELGSNATFEEFQERRARAGSNQTTINMGQDGNPLGAPPKDTVWARNPDGSVAMRQDTVTGFSVPVAVPVIGGTVEREDTEAKTKREQRQRAVATAATTVSQDIGRGLDMLDNVIKTKGMLGANARLLLSKVPGSAEYELSQFIESALSNIGLDRLQLMRETSPTGGALGQVPFQQQQRLEQVLGSLKLGQSVDVLEQNLKRVQNIYYDIIFGDSQERADAVEAGLMSPEESKEIDSYYHNLPFNVTGRTGGRPDPQAEVPSIKTDADYDKLPSGAIFRAPDGVIRRKP